MIERIIIENFKSIRKLDLELKPINILVGANGAGKSNFLSFFKLINSLYQNSLGNEIANNINSFLYFGRKTSKFFKGFVDIDNRNAVSFTIAPTFHGNSGYIQEVKVFHNETNKEKDYELWEVILKKTEIADDMRMNLFYVDDYEETKNIGQHFENLRVYHFQDTSDNARIKGVSNISDNKFLQVNGENIAAYLYYLQEKHSKEFKDIESQIRSVAPFFNRFDLQPDRIHGDRIELEWLEKRSDKYFNAYDLSDGTVRFIALVTLLMQPELPKIIIIDEPELGLHPFAINKLAAMLQAAAVRGSQVIISTQSTELISNFEPEDIITVDRDKEQSIFRRLNSTDLESWLEDYTLGDLWTKNLIGAMP